MYENVSRKTSKGIITLLIILIIMVIGLSSYIIYDKVISNNVNESKIKNKVKDDKKTIEDTESNIEEVKISDEKIEEYELDLNYLICSMIPLFSDIKYDTNYISDNSYKSKLVYGLLVRDENINPKVALEGYSSAYLLSDFIGKYYYVFGENITIEEINKSLDDKMYIESDLIYGYPVSGIGDKYVKINSINYNKNTKTYDLDIDLQDYNSNSGQVVKSKIEVLKNNDSYTIKYFGFIK